jgi:hypothetical protein
MTRRLLLALWAALLPASERERLQERLDHDVPTVPVSWALAAAQLALIPVWALMGVSYAHQVTGVEAAAILASEHTPTFTEAMLASIALGPLAFVFTPRGLLLEYVILTGVVRIAGLVASDRPTGDPLVTLVAWLRRLTGAEVRRRRRLRALGPRRPDRILRDGAGLLVLSSEDKPDWDEYVTVEHEGVFYRLVRREDRPFAGGIEVAYVLRRQQSGELIRRLVRLDAPSGPAPAANPRYGEPAGQGGGPHPPE